MKLGYRLIGTLLVAAALWVSDTSGGAAAAQETGMVSPDGNVRMRVFLDQERLSYAITFRDKPVVETSPFGFILDGIELTKGVERGAVSTYRVLEKYPWRGVHSQAVNDGNGTRIALRHTGSKTEYTLEIRVYNDGIAFRLLVPEGNGARVPDEATGFTLPTGSTVWHHNLRGHYEGEYTEQDIGAVPTETWIAPPLTVRLPGGNGYASITEANLVNYSGMALQANGKSGVTLRLGHAHPVSYPYELRYGTAEAERLSHGASVSRAITTPWRVVLIGADLNALVNSDLIHNLCPPPDPTLFPDGMATEWVKPGRAVWEYLDGRKRTLEEMKEYCRIAGELGFEHNVLEGFWQEWSDDQIRELVEYGKQRNVGIWLWKHSKELRDAKERQVFFQRCRRLGVVGAKIDFFDHEAKEVVDLYQTMLREAAENKLLINFHGSNKPTGESRTWPNELTREAIRGMEASKLRERARHNVILPFTRMLAGHADYTPLHFGERRADTTWAHQIASTVILLSPLLTFAANPTNIQTNPAVEMIKSIPAVWDETRVLPASEIGEVAIFARRSGNTWFLAILNGPTARTLEIPLSFLGKGTYATQLVRDNRENPAAVQIENATHGQGDVLKVMLREGGGYIARFSVL